MMNDGLKMWVVYHSEVRISHTIPLDDTEEHMPSHKCKCKPRMEQMGSGSILYKHNAWDCREAIEQAEDIIRNTDDA